MESKKSKRITAAWIVTVLTLFVISIVLGILMRLNQGAVIHQSPITFYANMTTHGLTMIGIWFVAGMAAVNYLLQRYVKTNYTANVIALVLTVIGFLMFWTTTFVGNFHAGWTCNLRLAANNTSVNVLVMSFDPRDEAEDMNLLASGLGLENDEQWTFAVTDSIDRLNRSIGVFPR